MAIPLLLAALMGIVFQFGIALVVVWVASGVPILFGGRRWLRGAPLFIVAGLLTIPTVVNEMRAVGQATANHNRDEAEARRLNEVFALATGQWAAQETIEFMVAELSPKAWNPDALALIIAVIQLKAERYNDVYQSSLLSRVVKTDTRWDSHVDAQMQATDDRAWTPLLEAAARGEPVALPDGQLNPGEEMMVLAWGASRALSLILKSLESLHGVPVPLPVAARELAPALEWFADYMNAPTETQASIVPDLTRIGLLMQLGAPGALASIGAVPLARSQPETVESFLFYSWAQEYVSLYSERWIVLAAMSGQDIPAMTQVNEYRRFLGLPVILESDVVTARQHGRLPFWAEQRVGAELSDHLESLETALRKLHDRFDSLALAWTIPRLSLP